MRTRATRRDSFFRRVLILLLLCHAGFAACQPLATPFGEERPPRLVMVARDDPADPSRYMRVFGDDLSDAVAIYRDGRRLRTTVPQILQRGDEIETAHDVIAVIRYPAGDVYIGAATGARIGSLDVLFGKVFARVRGLFSVENENVVAGVEGTEFAFDVARDGTVSVTVLDGAVRCSSKTLAWNPVRVVRGQTFAATDSNREPRVGPADPAELAQLRSWVRRVDNAVAPPTPPQSPPIPAPPLPPVPETRWGYCCDAGRVFRTTQEGCRGSLYNTQAEAYQRCQPVTMGYCCANGQVTTTTRDRCRGSFYFDQASAYSNCAPPPQLGYCCAGGEVWQTNRAQCRGSFFTDQASARRSCASPPPQSGYCCANGQVTSATRNQCRGNYFTDEASARRSCTPSPQVGYCCAGGEVWQTNRAQCRGSFYTDQASARKSCAPSPQLGYCCAGGEVSQTNRAQCRGSFYTDQASARKGCIAPPEKGYCCVGGKVSPTTRDRCTGTFARVQEEAQRMCRRKADVLIDRGIVTRPPPPRDDAPR
jgi:FecR-like protein